MTEAQMKEQLQAAQDMMDGLINQRNNAFNENVQISAALKAAQRRIQELEGKQSQALDGEVIPPAPKANGSAEAQASAIN